MILKKDRIAEVQLYILTTLVLAFAPPAFAQEEARKSHEEHRAAFDACLAELGVEKPEKGQRPQAPDEELRTKIDECLKEKGFEPPKFRGGRGGHHGPPPEDREGSGVR
ncbi:hypothetical protein [Bdellovibrio reynosensis]|uniref:Uncharacterized protein n=1 Tax=Bdellovibrio reynosensis TaxID=2835041 RepID=A0ABY4CC32_9BACT|nr:hypothetical protein [Bdellovibrio reynosensis]UOF02502.1 hypothetical protein MNR06_06000 [Bdellovibrio reynosensis]